MSVIQMAGAVAILNVDDPPTFRCLQIWSVLGLWLDPALYPCLIMAREKILGLRMHSSSEADHKY